MKTRGIVRISVALICLSSLSGCFTDESRFLSACKAQLRDRMKAPSTFKVTEVTEMHEELDLSYAYNLATSTVEGLEAIQKSRPLTDAESKELADAEFQALINRPQEGNSNPPRRLRAILTYESANSYGVPLQGFAECSYDAKFGTFDSNQASQVEIDGETNLDRLINGLQDMNQ